MRLFHWLNRIRKNERGNVLLVGAASMPLLIGSAALAVDTIQLSLAKRQLQRTADSSALAGTYALAQDQDIDTAVTRELGQNTDFPFTVSAIENAPTAGAYAGEAEAVRVVLTAQRTVPFMSYFTQADATLSAEATAAIVVQGNFCMISLEEGNVTGVTFSGSTNIDLGCGVMTNSTSTSAVVASGSSTVRASPIGAVGGVPASSRYVQPVKRLPYTAHQADPYADLPTPSPSSCGSRLSVQPNDPVTALTPGCWKGWDVKGRVTMAPGVYYIDGSSFALGSQANISGTGVTIIFTSTTPTNPNSFPSISMHAGAVINLAAPKSGTYEGVLFYQDRRAPFAQSTINGNSASNIEGGIYFPSQELTFNGNTGMQTRCIQLVAKRLVFTGNSSVVNECPDDGGAESFPTAMVRLVG